METPVISVRANTAVSSEAVTIGRSPNLQNRRKNPNSIWLRGTVKNSFEESALLGAFTPLWLEAKSLQVPGGNIDRPIKIFTA